MMESVETTPLVIKDVRAWCRNKFGPKWFDVEKAIKKERMTNARVALGRPTKHTTTTTTTKKKKAPNPFKPTYMLRMRMFDEDCIEKRTQIDPITCIGSGATYKKIAKREEFTTAGGLYLLDTTHFDDCFDFDDSVAEEGLKLYFGNHPFPGCGSRTNFDIVESGDTEEMVAQKLLKMEDIRELIIHDCVWLCLADATQEALLRDSSATEVYILNDIRLY